MSDPVKVWIDNAWLGSTGIGRMAHEILERVPTGVNIIDSIEYRGKVADPLTPYRLGRAINSSGADIYWSPGFMPPLTPSIPGAITVHDLIHLYFHSYWHRNYYNFVIRNLIRRVDKIFTVSEYSRHEILTWSGKPETSVITIPLAVGEGFTPDGPCFSPGFPYLLYVGNRRRHKNLERMLKAFSCSKCDCSIKLVISGDYDRELHAQASELGIADKLFFAGYISDDLLPSYYRGALAVLFVSLHEGFGLPILEGMACGTPVITADRTSMPEVAGNAAFMVDPTNVEAIADAIRKLCDDQTLRLDFQRRGFLRAKDFSWSVTACRYWDNILELTPERAEWKSHALVPVVRPLFFERKGCVEFPIIVNTRILSSHITGVQRYTIELIKRLGNNLKIISPHTTQEGISGHIWEQFVLPLKLHGSLLWSPSNTGPLQVSQQVVTIHDVVPLDHPELLNPRFASWYRFLLPKLVNRVQHIITISEFSKNRIMERTGVSSDKISVIPNGVSERFFPQPPDKINAVLEILGIPVKNYILTLASLEPRKNLCSLFEVWEMIKHQIPDDIWLIVAGAKGKASIFRDFGCDWIPQRVYFTGHVKDEYLPALFSGAIAFTYLSFYEGFGLPPLESMAAGTPVLTTTTTAIPEVVANAAITVDPLDIDTAADNLLKLINDASLREHYRIAGLERSKLFSWDESARKTMTVLNQIANV